MAHLIINIQLSGEADDRFRYYPYMTGMNYGNNRYSNILFVPTVKLTRASLVQLAKKNGIDSTTNKSLVRMFLSPNYTEQILNTFPKSTPANRDSVIQSNINLLIAMFLSKGTPLNIDRRSFVIENLEWDGKYTASKRKVYKEKSKFDVLYKVNITVGVIQSDGAKSVIRKMNVNCQTRRKLLRKAILDTLKYDIGAPTRSITIKKRQTPQMYSTRNFKLRKPYTRQEQDKNLIITPNFYSPFTMFQSPVNQRNQPYTPQVSIPPGFIYSPLNSKQRQTTLAERGRWTK